MGIHILSGGSSSYTTAPQPPEPDPRRWRILETTDIGGWCIALVNYPGCTTYQGNKLLVYACSSEMVRVQSCLDPHFLEDQALLSPVARFEPTPRGRMLAETLCQARQLLK